MAEKNKGRKFDRNRKWCEAYRLRGQREINKAIRLAKAFEKHPCDPSIIGALSKIQPTLLAKAKVSIPLPQEIFQARVAFRRGYGRNTA